MNNGANIRHDMQLRHAQRLRVVGCGLRGTLYVLCRWAWTAQFSRSSVAMHLRMMHAIVVLVVAGQWLPTLRKRRMSWAPRVNAPLQWLRCIWPLI
jgi:hypothetical protein